MSWNLRLGCLLLGLSSLAFSDGPESIRLGYDDFCPYSCLKDAKNGYFVDTVQQVLEAQGYKVVAIKGSWARLKTMAQKGQLELVVPLTRYETEELKLERNSLPLGTIEGRLFTHKSSSWRFKGEESLKGQSMAVIRDYGYPPVISALINDPAQRKYILTLASDLGTDQQVQMLASQRVTIVPSDRNAFLYHARRHGLENSVQIAGELPMEHLYTDLHVGIATQQPELRKKLRQVLDKGIEDLKKSGQLNRIKARYGVN
ncbi:MAG TPA: transporter substrate-binding domain-containing protein [Oligoflexus sp.]|uniref:substrate-binding periplasmic protein n=1 Tax=Oligoflexus sp. TaxID=1971216 RepID=UPI002D7FFCD3|nr:transporter substrate-binding domain-containing protein [Oligoflexus sp.]HET9240310.1 transporter substrate-binding domain-containing protein [Oligoflexus sp.]